VWGLLGGLHASERKLFASDILDQKRLCTSAAVRLKRKSVFQLSLKRGKKRAGEKVKKENLNRLARRKKPISSQLEEKEEKKPGPRPR